MGLPLLVIIGIVQGITEFLPVSSSGHLVFLQHVLDVDFPGITLEVAVHGGTLIAVLVFYRNDAFRIVRAVGSGVYSLVVERDQPVRVLARSDFYRGFTILFATLVTAAAVLPLEDVIVNRLWTVDTVAWAWLFTGLILLFTRGREPRGHFLTIGGAVLMGFAQAMAVIPGISRSGMTIFAALLLGLARDEAARFSFLLSVPAILGALVLDLPAASRALVEDSTMLPGLLAGVAAAAIVGYLALKLVVGKLKRGQLHHFTPYLWLLGAVTLVVRSLG